MAMQAIPATPTQKRKMRIDRIALALIDGLHMGLVRPLDKPDRLID